MHSTDDKVDCVGACVGVRGTRIKSIIDELGGERIDIIRWSTEPDMLIANALKPAEVSHIELEPSTKKALVLVDEDQLSLCHWPKRPERPPGEQARGVGHRYHDPR